MFYRFDIVYPTDVLDIDLDKPGLLCHTLGTVLGGLFIRFWPLWLRIVLCQSAKSKYILTPWEVL